MLHITLDDPWDVAKALWLETGEIPDFQPEVAILYKNVGHQPFQMQSPFISERRCTPHISMVSRSSVASFSA